MLRLVCLPPAFNIRQDTKKNNLIGGRVQKKKKIEVSLGIFCAYVSFAAN